MKRGRWSRFAERLGGALLAPAPDPRALMTPENGYAAALARLDQVLASTRGTRQRLEDALAASPAGHAEACLELARSDAADGDAAPELMRERERLAAQRLSLLTSLLRDVAAEERRLVLLRERVTLHAEILDLRREIADARRRAAAARYDASDSLLDLRDGFANLEAELAAAEAQAAFAEARANAIEEIAAGRIDLDGWDATG